MVTIGVARCPRCRHCTTCSIGKAARERAHVDADRNAPVPDPRVQAAANRNHSSVLIPQWILYVTLLAILGLLLLNVVQCLRLFSLTSAAYVQNEKRTGLTAELETEKEDAARLREREVDLIHNDQRLKRQFQMQAQSSTQRIGRLRKENMKLKMEIGDLWQKNDYLRMEEQNVTANLQEVKHFSTQRIGRLHKDKMKLKRQNGDLQQKNDYLHMDVQNLTTTLHAVKQFFVEQINEYTKQLDQLRVDHAEQLALVHQQCVGRIEERDERIHQLEVDFKRTNEKVLDLQVELHRTLSELDQCKTSQEAWNIAAKAAGGVAIVLASALAFPYAAPFVGAAVKTVFL